MTFHTTHTINYLWLPDFALKTKQLNKPEHKVPPHFSNDRNKKFWLKFSICRRHIMHYWNEKKSFVLRYVFSISNDLLIMF